MQKCTVWVTKYLEFKVSYKCKLSIMHFVPSPNHIRENALLCIGQRNGT